jgi:hypothetical protein
MQASALLDCVLALPQTVLRQGLSNADIAAILDALQGLLLAVARTRSTNRQSKRLACSACCLLLKLLELHNPRPPAAAAAAAAEGAVMGPRALVREEAQQLVADPAQPRHLALAVAVMGASSQLSSGAQLTDSHLQLLAQQQLGADDGTWLASCVQGCSRRCMPASLAHLVAMLSMLYSVQLIRAPEQVDPLMVVVLLHMSAGIAATGLLMGLTMRESSAAAWAGGLLQPLLQLLEQQQQRLPDERIHPCLISILCSCAAGATMQPQFVQASLRHMEVFVRQTAVKHVAAATSSSSSATKVAFDSISAVALEVLAPQAATMPQFYSLAASLLKAANVAGLTDGICVAAEVSRCLLRLLEATSAAAEPDKGSCLMLLGRCLLQLPGVEAEQLTGRIQGLQLQEVQMVQLLGLSHSSSSAGLTASARMALECCLVGSSVVCNNRWCDNLSGPSEHSLVSGKQCICAGCGSSRYCGRQCQRVHWRQHKPRCQQQQQQQGSRV